MSTNRSAFIREIQILYVAFLAGIACSTSGLAVDGSNASAEENWIDRFVNGLPPGFFNSGTYPSKSIPVRQIYPEWETATCVLISIPLSEVFRYSEFMAFVVDFLEATAPHTPVGVLYNWEE